MLSSVPKSQGWPLQWKRTLWGRSTTKLQDFRKWVTQPACEGTLGITDAQGDAENITKVNTHEEGRHQREAQRRQLSETLCQRKTLKGWRCNSELRGFSYWTGVELGDKWVLVSLRRNWTPLPVMIEMQNGTPSWKVAWQFHRRPSEIAMWPSSSTPKYIPKRNENVCWQRLVLKCS